MQQANDPSSTTRRGFLAASAAMGAVAAMGTNYAHAQGSDIIKVGVIGCGGRGSGAVNDCLNGAKIAGAQAQLVAAGDAFPERVKGIAGKYKLAADKTFAGLDAYKGVIDSGVDMVIMATPPGFRPYHFKAAIEAGKHVFFEKPVAVDPIGVRMVIAAAEVAGQKKLGVVAGTQRRHQLAFQETVKRLHDGAIGDLLYMRVHWDGGGIWYRPRKEGMSDVEYQMNNWYHYVWLCGDQICEQHVHNLDVAHWVLGGPPTSAYAQGGRAVRDSVGQKPGQIHDHCAVLYEYPNGVNLWSTCRHWPGDGAGGEYVVGSKGTANPGGGYSIRGGDSYRAPKQEVSPYVQEHVDLINSIKAGKPLNEGKQVAISTMMAIMGRMSAYTGKKVTWDFAMNKSQLDTMPKNLDMKGSMPEPDVAIPGKEKLI